MSTWLGLSDFTVREETILSITRGPDSRLLITYGRGQTKEVTNLDDIKFLMERFFSHES